MTKVELIQELCQAYPNVKNQDIEEVVHLILESIVRKLETGGRVEIRGFGTFSLRHRKARIGRNPKTGESVDVSDRAVVYFRAGSELKKRVNEGGFYN